MQMRTVDDYPQKNGTITGFGNAPAEYLELIINDLGLLMPKSTVSYIQNHYRTVEKREPDVSELIMLDILMYNSCQRTSKIGSYDLAELTTDSEDIKETFEDMMQKLYAIEPGRKGAIPFEKLLNLAGSYILSLMPEKYEKQNQKNSERSNIKQGVYIQIEKNDNIPFFLEKLKEKELKFSSRFITDNIIEEILKETDHAEITFPFSLPHLAAFGKGDLLVLCPKDTEHEIVYWGNELGLRMRRAGRKLKKGNIAFKNPAFEYALSSALLKSITASERAEAVKVFIPDELVSQSAACELVSKEKTEIEKKVENISALCSSNITSPYKDGIAQVICAAAGDIAGGTHANDIKMTHFIDYPKHSDPALLIAHIIGIYRAETELCIRSANNELRISSDIEKAGSLSVSSSPKRTPGGFGEGSLWLVSPECNDGEINFENVRRTFSYMSELISSGFAIRACALDTEGISIEDIFNVNGTECKTGKTTAIGSFLVLTKAELIPADGILTEKIGAVGIEDPIESSENIS